MKKTLIGFLCAATIISSAVPALAAGRATASATQKTTAVVTQKYTVAKYALKINDRNVDIGKLKIVKMKDQIMVPLRITSETLGFTVTWNGKDRSVHMDNGIRQTDLYIGMDNYFSYSSKAIGMTAPTSLGVAPVIIEGSTYVPVDFYKILFSYSNCVGIKENVISISTGSANPGNTSSSTDPTKPDKISPSANPAKPGKTPSTGIPNPLVNYSTLDEARKAVGFNFAVPAVLPEGYQMKDIIVINNELAEVFYRNADKEILYRTSKGNSDISGDYNVYDTVKTVPVGNSEVTAKGKGDSINLATWARDGVSFSLSFDEAVTEKTLSTIIESIK